MEHFTIFQDFYRVIAEMTEEEIVSAISNGTYRETVEDVRRILAEQGEKAANEKKIELPEITFQTTTGEDVQTQLSSSIWDTSW